MYDCKCVCNMKDIVALWEDLLALKSATLNLAWCFVGDFNVVRRSYDRKESEFVVAKRVRSLVSITL